MKITIKKVDTPINIIRKCKINKINGDKNIDSIYYNCKCQPENEFKDMLKTEGCYQGYARCLHSSLVVSIGLLWVSFVPFSYNGV